MVEAQSVDIKDTNLDSTGSILRLKFTEPTSPETFKFNPSNSSQVFVPPLLEDPYESKYVVAGKSEMSDHAGDGLFLKCDVPANKTISFYNGIRVKPGDEAPFFCTGYQIFVDWNKKSVSS